MRGLTSARVMTSWATISTRSPARCARAVRSSAASRALSRRGSSPTRAADVRPVSSTRTTRRSRSGRYVRTATVCVRAVVRQSICRTSSPGTYSRSRSNSVPRPEPRSDTCPSTCRSRISFSGSNRRDVKGGSTRRRHGTTCRPWREASPSGPYERMVILAGSRSPRRSGTSVVTSRRRSPPASETRWLRGEEFADGGHASRTSARSRRDPAAVSVRAISTGSPRRPAVAPSRTSPMARTGPASTTSRTTSTSRTGAPTTSTYELVAAVTTAMTAASNAVRVDSTTGPVKSSASSPSRTSSMARPIG